MLEFDFEESVFKGSLIFFPKNSSCCLKGIRPVTKGYQNHFTVKRRKPLIKTNGNIITKGVFSVFEPHIELIMRGRREKPVEFGHKLLLVETRENFIIDFDLMKKKKHESILAGEASERIKILYGITPKVFAVDKGFCPRRPMYKELEAS